MVGAGLCAGLRSVIGLWVAGWDLAVRRGRRCVGSGCFSALVALPDKDSIGYPCAQTDFVSSLHLQIAVLHDSAIINVE